MFKDLELLELLKTLSIIALLALPPWIVLNRYIKHFINKTVRIIIFVLYIAATIFTQTLMPFIVVVFSLYFMRRARNEEEINYYLRPMGERKLVLVISALVFKVIMWIINLWFAYFLISKGIKLEGQEISNMLINAGWLKVILLSIMTVVFAPILEEFIFRHILYRNAAKKIGKVLSCILTSFLFMLLHYNLAGAISFFGVGVFNCYLYEKHGYRAAVLNHFIFNLISVLIIILIKLLGVNIPT
jgi:uncharacterized protein